MHGGARCSSVAPALPLRLLAADPAPPVGGITQRRGATKREDDRIDTAGQRAGQRSSHLAPTHRRQSLLCADRAALCSPLCSQLRSLTALPVAVLA